jgi:hypothetical protein
MTLAISSSLGFSSGSANKSSHTQLVNVSNVTRTRTNLLSDTPTQNLRTPNMRIENPPPVRGGASANVDPAAMNAMLQSQEVASQQKAAQAEQDSQQMFAEARQKAQQMQDNAEKAGQAARSAPSYQPVMALTR